YLDANNGGSMKTGWINVEGKYYYLDTDSDPNKIGVMKTGWLKDNDRWYYLDANNGGSMKTGWVNVEGKYYYLDTDSDPNKIGVMKTGWVKDNGKWYYLDGSTDGSMKTGWFQENDQWYYLDANQGGAMVTGQVTIGGQQESFDENGHWISVNKYVAEAKKYLGVPYVWGGATPSGFDCSGFISYVYKVGRQDAAGFYNSAQKISNPQPGDLVFFKNTYKNGISHIGIVVGDGRMIHAGDKGIEYSNLNSPYNQQHFAGYGRLK
ncbi:C40 family peptidase, partial [Bacillus sp. CCNWLW75]